MYITYNMECRILLSSEVGIKKICKLIFTESDTSLYLIPYSPLNKFYYGKVKFSENQLENTFDYTTQKFTEDIPKLSIHQTGQVHIKGSDGTVGPIYISPFVDIECKHIATVVAEKFSVLPNLEGKIRNKSKYKDILLKVDELDKGGRIVIYLNAQESIFPVDCNLNFELKRPTLNKPLYFGVVAFLQDALGNDDKSGMMIISGWDPQKEVTDEQEFLFIKGV